MRVGFVIATVNNADRRTQRLVEWCSVRGWQRIDESKNIPIWPILWSVEVARPFNTGTEMEQLRSKFVEIE